MYPSDYLYASGYIASDGTTTGSRPNFGNSNWLYKGYEWTITPRSNTSNNAFYVNFGGMSGCRSSDGHGLRPVLYLKSSVYVTGGTGTFEDPYEIGN